MTPHASFLALPFAPREALDNLRALADRYPIYGPNGFRASADVSGGKVKLDPGDLEEGLKTANAIGDDTLQKAATGHVTPEGFTHGTSAQRVEWLKK